MTAPSYAVYNGTTGVAPRMLTDDCEDLGGLFFENAVGANSPDPHRHPSALDFMQLAQTIQRHGCMVPVLSAGFYWDGVSAYSIDYARGLHRSIAPGTGFFVTKGPTGWHYAAWSNMYTPTAMLRGKVRCRCVSSAIPLSVQVTHSGINAYLHVSSPLGESDAAGYFVLEVF